MDSETGAAMRSRLRRARTVLPVFPVRSVLLVLAGLLGACPAWAGDIPFRLVDGYILVHACVHAQPVTLILDSGASASVLSLDAARRLHIALGKPLPVDGVDVNATAFAIQGVTA